MDGLTHIGIEVHRIDKVHIRVFLAKVFHGGDHIDEAIAEILSSVACNQHKFLSSIKTGYIVTCILEHIDLLISKGFVTLEFINNHMEGIYHCIAGNEDLAVGFLFLQVMFTERSWSKIVGSDTSGNLAVHFLRPRTVYVVGAKTCLNMTNGNLLVECSQSCSSACSCIAVY